jgi:type IV pilus assembly protein PilC
MKAQQSLVQWYRQMAVLLKCGIPVTGALRICAAQTTDSELRRASDLMIEELRVGQRLSHAMATVGVPFEEIHWGTVRVGEMQGDLGLVFEHLADHCEETFRVKRRLRAALAYPTLVLSISLVGLYLLVRFLAPVLVDVGDQLGQEPNFVSRALLLLGRFFEHEILSLSVMALAFWLGRKLALSLWTKRRKSCERSLFRVPLIGGMLRLSALIRICQTMETMVSGGLPLTEGFVLTAKTCGSVYYAEEVLLPAVDRVKMGESVCASLRGAPGLPGSFLGLLVAGEESGRLDQTFRYLAKLYEMELMNAIDSFLAALEPISISTVGLVVLGVLVSVFIPLSRMLSAV